MSTSTAKLLKMIRLGNGVARYRVLMIMMVMTTIKTTVTKICDSDDGKACSPSATGRFWAACESEQVPPEC